MDVDRLLHDRRDDRDQSHGCVSVNRANRGLPLEILFCEGLQKRLLFDLNPLGDFITGFCKLYSLKDF